MGACASSGGVFDTYAVVQGIDRFIPVDVYVPGCPPRPEQLIRAVLDLQDKVRATGTVDGREFELRKEFEGPAPLAKEIAPANTMIVPGNLPHRDAVARMIPCQTPSKGLTQRFGAESFSTAQFRDNQRVHVAPERAFEFLKALKELGFDMLADANGRRLPGLSECSRSLRRDLWPDEHDERRTTLAQDDAQRSRPPRSHRLIRSGRGPIGWSVKFTTCTASSSRAIRICGGS